MAAGVTVKIKRKAGAFIGGELAAGELGQDVTNSKLYSSNDGATVFEFDTTGILAVVDDTTPELGGNLDTGGNRIINLPAPAAGGDPATKTYVDGALQGLNWQQSVINTQTDGTLDPGVAPTTGDRYIVTATGALHANFGSIAGVGNNDIVEYNGSAFVVDLDVSVVGEGYAVYNKTSNDTVNYNGTAWVGMGGVAAHGNLTGLGDDDHTQYAIITSGAGAPGATPARSGAIYVDTSAPAIYVAKGSSSAADWQLQLNKKSLLNDVAMVIDGGTI